MLTFKKIGKLLANVKKYRIAYKTGTFDLFIYNFEKNVRYTYSRFYILIWDSKLFVFLV